MLRGSGCAGWPSCSRAASAGLRGSRVASRLHRQRKPQGTTVVAAIASTDRITSVGIDVERRDEKGVPAIHGLDAAEQPWSVSDAEGQVILFSVKEAVYKTLNPILGQSLDFAEVVVSWARSGPVRRRGVALACGVALDVRCSIAVPSCVLSTALWPVTAAPGPAPPRKPGLPVRSPPE